MLALKHTTSSMTSMFLSFLLLISTVLAAGDSSNQTIVDGALFEKYQFLSPGIMMGFIVVLILGSIMFVGVSALSSLEVTYPAFEKENGPGAKKQQ